MLGQNVKLRSSHVILTEVVRGVPQDPFSSVGAEILRQALARGLTKTGTHSPQFAHLLMPLTTPVCQLMVDCLQ